MGAPDIAPSSPAARDANVARATRGHRLMSGIITLMVTPWVYTRQLGGKKAPQT